MKNASFLADVNIRWFENGQTNVAFNCIDRHLKKYADQVAIIFEGDNPYIDQKITYAQLHDKVCRLANVLKACSVRKGDRVTIYQGRYFTGDGCPRDADGYYRITGRVDDVLNVSGHRLGTAEVEAALASHGQVAVETPDLSASARDAVNSETPAAKLTSFKVGRLAN